MTKKYAVNYQELKERVGIEDVLRRYGFFEKLKKSGDNFVGCCPIHSGVHERQFSVNLEGNKWNCFGGCGEGGNMLDFVAMKEFGKKDGKSIFKAGKKIQDWFPELVREGKGEKKPVVEEVKEELGDNEPLDFKLKGLSSSCEFFEKRGIAKETVDHFGLGLCKKGIMVGRVAIPIHNVKGELVAYCGRAVSSDQIDKGGKYKLPKGFVKSLEVYNLNRQEQTKNPFLILVESYLSVWRLHQLGLTGAVAVMGASVSERQEEAIKSFLGVYGRLALLFDDDEAGKRCGDDCVRRFADGCFVRLGDIAKVGVKKPHEINSIEQFKEIFNGIG